MTTETFDEWFGREFKGIKAGDVFCVPLPDGRFAFGRMMNARDGATIAEFFRHTADDCAFDDKIIDSGQLIAPIGILITDIEHKSRKRPWKVVHSDPDYIPKNLMDIKFYAFIDDRDSYYTLSDLDKFFPIAGTEHDDGKINSILPNHCDFIVNLIQERLEVEG